MSAILKQKLIDIANGFTKYGLWKGSGSGALSELTDVTLTDLQANDVLTYNGSEWVNDDNLQTQIDTLNSNLSDNEIFEIVGVASGFAKTDFCTYNAATKHVKVICYCTCNSLASSGVLCRVPQKYIPSSRVPALIHEVNGDQTAQVGGLLLSTDGNVYQSLSNGLKSVTFELDYYI